MYSQDLFAVVEVNAEAGVRLRWVLSRRYFLQALVDQFKTHGEDYGSSEFYKYIKAAMYAPVQLSKPESTGSLTLCSNI